jgi:hypothetical protein
MKSRENGLYNTISRVSGVAVAALTMLAAGAANAQLPMPGSTQFDITGLIQEATLDPACAADPHCGGTITLQGHKITIPKETIVLYPANASTWQELFAYAPAPYGLNAVQASGVLGASGLAMNDLPVPLNNYEGHVVGNRVLGGSGGPDLYIAGLVYVSSHSLNSGAGFINFIDYALGEIRVGGVIGDSTTGARVRINDPSGRFGRVNSPDQRWSVDPENPTIMAATGFPMCLPRFDPATKFDPDCPQTNRPSHIAADGSTVFDFAIDMLDPRSPTFVAGGARDPNFQAPLEVGDYVSFSGIIVKDLPATPAAGDGPTVGPWPLNGAAGTYVSAWAITNNVGIWTADGASPAYVMIDTALLGTGGLTVLGAGEAAFRTRFEGMTTDTSRNIHLYGVDFDSLTGATSDRDYGTIGVDPGAPNGAVRGRWRFRPPCDPFGSTPLKPDKACVMNQVGTFLPPPREVRAVIEGAWQPNAPAGATNPNLRTAANGLTWGQYRNPAIEYIFPENVPGTAIVPNNFGSIPFLTQGGYPSFISGLPVIPKQLNPWPDATIPAAACTPPTVSAGGPYTVASGSTVLLNGVTVAGTGPFTFAWTPSSGTFLDPTLQNPTFSATGATSPVNAAVNVKGACGTASASTTITVNAAAAPTVAPIALITATSGGPVSFTVTGTDPANQALTFNAVQTGGPAVAVAVAGRTANSALVSFTAPTVTVGSATITISVTATNVGGTTSAAATATVTVKPVADQIVVTSVEYRVQKQRLIVQVTTTSTDPALVLTLQPYLTNTGVIFDPAPLGASPFTLVAGVLQITLVGAPQPSTTTPSIVVKSNIGGVSAPSGITKLR